MVYWSLLISGSIYVCIYASPSIPIGLMINNLLFDQVTETIRPQVRVLKKKCHFKCFSSPDNAVVLFGHQPMLICFLSPQKEIFFVSSAELMLLISEI